MIQAQQPDKEKDRKGKKGAVQGNPVQRPSAAFTQALAHEIAKNLISIGKFTTRPFRKPSPKTSASIKSPGEQPVLVDTSVLIDGRIVAIANSGFLTGMLVVPEFVLREVQHIADSTDSLRRNKGRRGLEVVNKLKSQKANKHLVTKVIREEPPDIKDVDRKLVMLAKTWKARLLTVDFNLGQLARASGIKVLNVNDLAQAVQMALMPGEELKIRITHEGRERQQGVGYLTDGTMIIVEDAKDKIGTDVTATIVRVHQTPAGQIFFAKL